MKKIFFKEITISFFILGVIGIFTPFDVFASEKLFVDPYYDFYSRKEIDAENILDIYNLRFFVDKDYYDSASQREKERIIESLSKLADEFNKNIYPNLTSLFGNEPYSRDGKITILFHQMKQSSGGYFNTGDQYYRNQYSRSNERNMLYLNTSHIHSPLLFSYLAHEFIHIITFNQKEVINRVYEEIWLNELRAEYAITYLGYDNDYKGSNLENRVNIFLRDSNISLTEWTGKAGDYGAINLFAQYLVDHYGVIILADSLKSPYVGIESINYALSRRGYKDTFSDIFTNWLITLFINDCNFNSKYCYKNENLKDLRIMPQMTYLPETDTAQIIVSISTKEWMPNWQRISGGSGNINIFFNGDDNVNFKVLYLICDREGNCSINSLSLDNKQEGKISLDNFKESIVVIPSIQNKIKGFNGTEKNYQFSLDISTKKENDNNDREIDELLERIENLKKEVERLQILLNSRNLGSPICFITNNLYFGIMGSSEVRCLQEALKKEGKDIYPEEVVSGNFLSLTRDAVIRFQAKYSAEILSPLNLTIPTGYVGELTRKKINSLLGF